MSNKLYAQIKKNILCKTLTHKKGLRMHMNAMQHVIIDRLLQTCAIKYCLNILKNSLSKSNVFQFANNGI